MKRRKPARRGSKRVREDDELESNAALEDRELLEDSDFADLDLDSGVSVSA